MNYNGTMYGFLYNVQGDVVALFNEDSDVIALVDASGRITPS
ncbi:hypothetical protein [Paenibacillus sp.]|nr:hypothetical protein [Paenibacillus sp.]